MTNVTSGANKRTSNKWYTSAKTVPTNYGSRLTRAAGHTENFFGHAINGVADVIGATVNALSAHNVEKIGTGVENALVSSWKWLNSNPDNNKYQGVSVANQSPNTKYKNFGKQTAGVGGGGGKGGAGNPPVIPIQSDPDQSYSWNLPPHEWSLPIDPSEINDGINTPTTDSHSLRRGKIFLARKYAGPTASNDAKTSTQTFNRQGTQNYGFQFLWNPETFSQSTSVNWGITPNQNDATAILTGLTSANSTIDFTLRIDRTNDFAAAKALNTKVKNPVQETQLFNSLQEVSKYYKKGQAPNSDTDFANNMEAKITDLLTRGTEADLEFLYRTINGDGYKSSWGGTTSNISFLLPTIIRLDLGPQRFVGMIQSVNVNHLAFTREMIPIRTDVQLSVDLRAGTGLTTSNFGVAPDSAATVTTR
jgi:hypothetical protein